MSPGIKGGAILCAAYERASRTPIRAVTHRSAGRALQVNGVWPPTTSAAGSASTRRVAGGGSFNTSPVAATQAVLTSEDGASKSSSRHVRTARHQRDNGRGLHSGEIFTWPRKR